MLLFILCGCWWSWERLYFKTSHVIVYHLTRSNHILRPVFQNISCYCLSIIKRRISYSHRRISKHLMLLFIACALPRSSQSQLHFKTSHVIVYRRYSCIPYRLHPISKHLMLLFIRAVIPLLHNTFSNFKTSHVIVYRTNQLLLKYQALYFKTSHVIVYPSHFRVF